jgi:hypothetical protein
LLGHERRVTTRTGSLPSTTSRRAPPVPQLLASPYPSQRGVGGAERPRDVPPPPPAPSFFRSLLSPWGGR